MKSTIRTLASLIGIGLLVGGVFALWKYYDSIEKEFRSPLWERHVQLYMDAAKSASILATADEGDDWKAAKNRFYSLYHGELCIVEDDAVEGAMVEFKTYLEGYEAAKTPQLKARWKETLKSCSLILAHRCRESLGISWHADLDSLKAKYTNYPMKPKEMTSSDAREPSVRTKGE